MELKKKSKGKIGIKIARIVVIMNFLLGCALITFSILSFRKSFRQEFSDKAQNTSRMAADMIDGDRLKAGDYVNTLEKDEYYLELEELFSKLKKDSDATYLYVEYPEDDHFVYILDATYDGDRVQLDGKVSSLGDVCEYEGDYYDEYYIPDVKLKTASEEMIPLPDSGYGKALAAWAPVVDSDGNLVCMVEADYTLDVVNKSMRKYIEFYTGYTLVGIFLMVIAILIYIRKVLGEPLEDVTDIIASFKNGEFVMPDKEIKTGDEIQNVYETFVQMTNKINDYVDHITKITAEKGRIETELNVATQIQADMLPSIFPAFPDKKEMDIYATMRPAKEVGGDFYDFFLVDEDHLVFLIADVSGKGVPAALFMVIAKTIIKNNASLGLPVNEVFERTNNQLCEGNKEGYFVTSWIGMLDLKTGELEYANAGHNPPVIMRKSGCEWNECDPGLVLAAMDGLPYSMNHMKLEPGDRIYLYTDGVPESINTSTEEFGEDRLITEFAKTREMPLQDAIHHMQNSVDTFAGEEEQFDDITMVIMEYKG